MKSTLRPLTCSVEHVMHVTITALHICSIVFFRCDAFFRDFMQLTRATIAINSTTAPTTSPTIRPMFVEELVEEFIEKIVGEFVGMSVGMRVGELEG